MSDHDPSIDPNTSPVTVIFGDFSCPFSALAHRRAMRRADRGDGQFVWHPVEHDPSVPIEGPTVDDEQHDAFAAELDQIRELLTDDEPDDLRVPTRRLNTARLNRLFASLPTERRDQFAEAVFDAYWRSADDPQAETVVEASGAQVTPDSEQRAADWQHEWEAVERRIVPMMRLPEGKISRGLGALARLQ